MKTRFTILGVGVLALLSVLLTHTAAQETPSNVPTAHRYVPETIRDQLAGVMRGDAIHKITTSTTKEGTTTVVEMPPESLSDEFVNTSDDPSGAPMPADKSEDDVLIQVHPSGRLDVVTPQGSLFQLE